MNKIVEARRLPSPAPAPHALGYDGTQLWMGSRDTSRIYAIDPNTGSARDEGQAPGIPWGLTCAGDQLFVCCGEPPDDNRFIHHFTPGRGFHGGGIPAPDNTGSQLGYDGDTLYLVQWYRKRILAIDERGTVGTIVNGFPFRFGHSPSTERSFGRIIGPWTRSSPSKHRSARSNELFIGKRSRATVAPRWNRLPLAVLIRGRNFRKRPCV